ncbi:bifunctional precorrin-2 dehydrogenase/sirohydrochlorin ferrochelatase [Paenibacillus sp. sptzw28]|uniref:precorrin-2 dehydrogenase/sirohydrochlorin ferrochelatase family protein n=1 Tax=Paenibacillus sp. sptzw28 TaxID=715179 RepID=UPI001C6E0E23|nr:bifunctional precorrin-2 dehydrogenase/sirohydrochlorin ferrochelatase [Paenibacillus sp. sptzw28]QYR23364.1 bifunctional precorrin-2 dehydrogenase/sirohydrochlorin ferrochelatase [Paenibacillus sp. sptzw28]
MARYYPLMVSLAGKQCIVIGGGVVAERKVQGLLEAGADHVVVISPAASEGLKRLVEDGSIALEQREYQEEDVAGAFLVFAATDERETNRSVSEAAVRFGALVNAADDAAGGDFITPSAVRRGDLLLTVTTGGASPALAARIKRKLAVSFSEEYGVLVARLGQLRERMLADESDEKRRHAVLRLAAEEAEQRIDGSGGPFKEESIDEWMKRLQCAVDGRQT